MVSDEYPPDPGGVSRSVQRLARSLSGTEYEISVAVLEQESSSQTLRVSMDGAIRVTRFSFPEESANRQRAERAERMMRFLYTMRRNPADLVHAFFPTTTGLIAGVFAKTLNKPFLASFRGNDIHHGILSRHLQTVRWVMEQADCVTFVNSETAALALAVQPRNAPWEVIRNGVRPISRERNNDMSARNSTPVIGMSGVFRSKKGMDCLFRACSRLREAHVPFRLMLVGDFAPLEKEYWQAQLEEQNLAAITTLTGFVRPEDIPHHLNQMDVFVYPTLYDGCPNSLLEAASAGMPIVASRTAAVTELLCEDAECLVHTPDDPEELAACLQKLLTDAELRVELGKGAKRRIRESFTLEREERQWRALYRRLIH